MMKNLFSSIWTYVLAIVAFALIASLYMYPELEGKVIIAHDNLSWRGARQEVLNYHEETGEDSWWTGSVFSGMPNYQIGGGQSLSGKMMYALNKVTHYGCNNSPIFMVFFYLIGFFALLLAFGVNKWLAAVGAVAMAFSSYFFIIIGASHNSKTATLALMAFVVGGFYLIYNDKKVLGVCLTMLFVAVGFYPHPQMSYYYCFIIGFLFLAELWKHFKTKEWKKFAVSSVLFLGSFLIGLGTGFSLFYANSEYMGETMRGGHSDLVKDNDSGTQKGGLDLDYATAWSYGIDETMTLMIPNFNGGSSNYSLNEKSELYTMMMKNGVDKKSAKQFCQNVPLYWGDQPFTAGPVYVGAIICFLFVLGLMIVEGPYKWALLAVTLLSITLSWGNNFMTLTRLFFDVVPMYNKFRAVSSILIIAEVTMPLLGFMALKKVIEKDVDQKKILKSIYVSAGVTGGLCLFFALFGGSFYDFSSTGDQRLFSHIPEWLGGAVIDQRASMFSSDCWRSFFFIAIAASLIWFFAKFEKMSVGLFASILGMLILSDMWPVDKRYMNDSAFSPKKQIDAYFKKKPYEEELLKDPSHFRVLNLSANVFNESRTSYYFKSIGGYSAVKLRRYQDLIDQHISPELNPAMSAVSQTAGRLQFCNGDSLFPVLNMLNAKYFIVPLQNGEELPVENTHAMGNAWFVSDCKIVDTPNEECDALSQVNLRDVAVLDTKFASYVKDQNYSKDSTSSILLTKYTPEYIEYESSSSKNGLAVFSEIYYPYGWKAYIDGEFMDHIRVDYMLRALNIPAGNHKIRFEFRPDSVENGDIIAVICVIILYLTLIASVIYGVLMLRKR